MYEYEVSKKFQKTMFKLSKKNKPLYKQLLKKIEEIINSCNIEYYKNLRYDMKDSKRVHVGHSVLIFQFEKNNNKIKFDDFGPHDDIYKKK